MVLALLAAGLANVAPGQDITEFTTPTADSDPRGIVAGPDGNLWFTELGGKIGRITTAGVITEFTLPDPSAILLDIAPGPDGNLWFTEPGGFIDKIGRITPAGVITEFTVPTHAGGVQEIAAGPDGALWFTEGNKIGRITTSGRFTEFTLPRTCPTFSGSCYLQGIAAGPDGNLWFTEAASNQIGRITTAGVITEFSIPTASSGPTGIAAGPDGNLWFAEPTNKIGRITTSGVVTEFSMADMRSAARNIVAGPDGNLWFTDLSGKIGRITPSGVITEFEFAVPIFPAVPFDIAAGPDGNLWFTETGSQYGSGEKIGRITTVSAGLCVTDSTALCLNGGRFRVKADWRAPSRSTSGQGTAASLTSDTGYFWFFNPDNVEMIVKVLAGCGINGHEWVFAGGLTDVEVTLTVTDTQTGEVKIYVNPAGTPFQPIQDTAAFASCPASLAASFAAAYGIPGITPTSWAKTDACAADPTTLCLSGGSFQVQAAWRAPSQGTSGQGAAVSLTSDTGYFWFFNSSNVEVITKVLDACSLNTHKWVFAAGLTDVEVTLTVTDTQTGSIQTYVNPAGTAFQPIQDTAAFTTCP